MSQCSEYARDIMACSYDYCTTDNTLIAIQYNNMFFDTAVPVCKAGQVVIITFLKLRYSRKSILQSEIVSWRFIAGDYYFG